MSGLPSLPTSADTKPAQRPSPRFHPVEKKRRIVEEPLRPHASVARVAQAHGVNANQVFYWRKQYQQGLLGPAPSPAALLPVQISDLVSSAPAPVVKSEALLSSPPRRETVPTGTIHLELVKAKLHIEGVADPASLRIDGAKRKAYRQKNQKAYKSVRVLRFHNGLGMISPKLCVVGKVLRESPRRLASQSGSEWSRPEPRKFFRCLCEQNFEVVLTREGWPFRVSARR